MLRRWLERLGGGAAPAAGDDRPRAAQAAAQAGRLGEALALYRALAAAAPAALDGPLGAGNVLVDLWRLDEALIEYETALARAPQSRAIVSALLFHRHYAAASDAPALFAAHREAGRLFMQKATPPLPPRPRAPAAARLRIGYVSPNFSRHSVGYFIEPVIRAHDRSCCEVYCYHAHARADETTARIRALADGWREVATLDDAALAAQVRADGIDILVDLAGHSKGNRLAAFALKPAPLQVTWLGYPDTTGLAAIDLRVTDAVADPAPQADALCSERLARIDGCFLCYQPPADCPPPGAAVNPASAVAFASFNNIAKLNRPTIEAWSAILAAMPGSRLLLKSATLEYTETVERVLEAFEDCGVEPGRVEARGWVGVRAAHLALYAGVDIALDTFPYNGTTTTCEALWMGVPVVTRAGDVHMARVGASLLGAAGLGELVATDAAGYVERAVALARDEARRRELRTSLRARLAASPLLDHAGFTRRLEQAYREAWARVTSPE